MAATKEEHLHWFDFTGDPYSLRMRWHELNESERASRKWHMIG
jgi:hypothetical protein